MIVNIENVGSGISGWSAYVLGKNNERKNAKLIFGDTQLGDKICNMVDYKSGNYTRLVISFSNEDNVKPEQGRELVKEFIEHFMYGFRKDEYHVDCVEHTDTNHLHYHLRIPKLNLLTQTQLKPYWHQADIDRKKAIIDYMAVKHDLIIGTDRLKVIKKPEAAQDRINTWRADRGQDTFDFSKKSSRNISEEKIVKYIKSQSIDSFNTLKSILTNEMGLDILKVDKDRSKGFHYITVANETGKMRLKGEIFSEEFYEKDAFAISLSLITNDSFDATKKSTRKLEEVSKRLKKENKKRLKFIVGHYKEGRRRAYAKKREILKQKPQKNDTHQIKHKGSENDRDRTEIIRRIRAIRRRKSERERILRENHIRHNEQFSRTFDQINRNAEKIDGIIENTERSTIGDNKTLEEAIEARQFNRGAQRQLTSVFRYFGKQFERFKRRIDSANKSLFGAVIDVIKKIRIRNSSSSRLDREMEELLDNLMSEKYFDTDREERKIPESEAEPTPGKGTRERRKCKKKKPRM